MKICFAGSIRAGRDDAAVYDAVVRHLTFGEVPTGHVGGTGLSGADDDGPDGRYIQACSALDEAHNMMRLFTGETREAAARRAVARRVSGEET